VVGQCRKMSSSEQKHGSLCFGPAISHLQRPFGTPFRFGSSFNHRQSSCCAQLAACEPEPEELCGCSSWCHMQSPFSQAYWQGASKSKQVNGFDEAAVRRSTSSGSGRRSMSLSSSMVQIFSPRSSSSSNSGSSPVDSIPPPKVVIDVAAFTSPLDAYRYAGIRDSIIEPSTATQVLAFQLLKHHHCMHQAAMRRLHIHQLVTSS